VALIVVPSLVGRLLLGAELSGVAIPVARVTGIALVGLGVACWPNWTALFGMLTYGTLVTVYLGYLGLAGEFSSVLLWPAVLLHALLTVLLTRWWFKERARTGERKSKASE
jgi:Na+-driven multidrug efflux pump